MTFKVLKTNGIIRTKNLVGDLGEYYCQELLKIKLCDVVNRGFDGFSEDGHKVEVKTRRLPSSSSKITFKGSDFDYCLFVELNEFFEPVRILKIQRTKIVQNLDKKGRLTFSKIMRVENEQVYFK